MSNYDSTRHRNPLTKPQKTLLAWAAVIAIAVTGIAATVLFNLQSNAAVAVETPPVQFSNGAGAGDAYIESLTYSQNRTSFDVTVKAHPETTVTVQDFVRLRNSGAAAQTVTLSTPQVALAAVEVYTIEFRQGGTLVGTLDLKAANPSVTFTNLAPNAELQATVTVGLASGAGNHNAAPSSVITMTLG